MHFVYHFGYLRLIRTSRSLSKVVQHRVLRRGVNYYIRFVVNFICFQTVKEFSRSVNIDKVGAGVGLQVNYYYVPPPGERQ